MVVALLLLAACAPISDSADDRLQAGSASEAASDGVAGAGWRW